MIVLCAGLRKFILEQVEKSIPFIAKLQEKRNFVLDTLFFIITAIAGVGIYATILPAILLFYPEKHYTEIAFGIVFTAYLNIMIGNFLKNWFACPRPYGDGIKHLKAEKDYGFPSTHTMNAIANTGFVVFAMTEGIEIRIAYFVYVVLVAISRMYMGVHSPIDVLFGVIFGTINCIFMVNCYDVFLELHSQVILLPVIFLIQCAILVILPRCYEYNVTPRRTAMISGCAFAACFALAFNLHFTTTNILPAKEYAYYQMSRLGSLIFESIISVAICLGIFGFIGFLIPSLIEKNIEKTPKLVKLCKKIEGVCVKYRLLSLKDDISEYRCDSTMIRYIYEVPLAYFSGFIGGLCIVYVSPQLILHMNPSMILN